MTSTRPRRSATTVALAVLLAAAACARGSARPAVADHAHGPASLNAALCQPATAAPSSTTLDWETARQQSVPDAPPQGWSGEYEPGLLHPGNGEPQVRVARAPDPVRAGAAAARFELRRGDPVINYAARVELATPAEPRGADRWYAFSVYLPESWVHDRSTEILAQWHQHQSIEGNPPLALATDQGNWEILAAWEGHSEQSMIGAYVTGRWTDWRVHVKWSTGADGVVQVWKDDRPVAGHADKRGRNTYRSVHGIYLKVGIYKWDWSQHNPTDTTDRFMFLDELRIAPTRAGVAIPAPPPEACYRPDVSMP
jgi:hypothetical protein